MTPKPNYKPMLMRASLNMLSLILLTAPGQYGEARVFTEDETVSFACLPGITLKVSDLFAGAPDTSL